MRQGIERGERIEETEQRREKEERNKRTCGSDGRTGKGGDLPMLIYSVFQGIITHFTIEFNNSKRFYGFFF